MIRNRSTGMITSSCNDLESNLSFDGKSNLIGSKMLGGSRRWNLFISVFVVGILVYVILLVSSPSPLEEHARSKESSEEQLTIVMNTFKRNEMMIGKACSFFCVCVSIHLYSFSHCIVNYFHAGVPKRMKHFVLVHVTVS